MRFCQVTTFYPPHSYGGDGILVQQICEALADRGHQVDVVYCQDAFAIKRAPATDPPRTHPNIRIIPLASRWGVFSPLWTQQTGRPGPKAKALRRVFEQDYDVVHFHNISLVGGPAVLPMSRAPVTLLTPHDHWLICPLHVLWKNRSHPCDKPECLRCNLRSGVPPQAWRYTDLLSRALESVDLLLPPSRFTADQLASRGIDRPMRVLPSFTRISAREWLPPAAGATAGGPATFLYSGRLEPSKGLPDLVETFLAQPRHRLLVAGDGSLANELRRRSAGARNIELLGRVDHARVPELLREATALVMPVVGPEVLSLSVLEALACGVPVLARRAGGVVEPLARGGGLVYDHPGELPALLDRLADEPELCRRLSREARAAFEAHHSEERWVEHYMACVEDVVASRSGAADRSEDPRRSGVLGSESGARVE